jgi:hypothetical protein
LAADLKYKNQMIRSDLAFRSGTRKKEAMNGKIQQESFGKSR